MILLQHGIELAIVVLLAIVIAIVFHEVAHALVAKWNGDLTAQYARRITLNPVRHFDLTGFVMLALVGFGWAKPVPVNIDNFNNRRRGTILVSLAGIKINLILAFLSAFFLVIIERFSGIGGVRVSGVNYYHLYAVIHFVRGIPNHLIGTSQVIAYVFGVFFFVLLNINVMLALFNLLPLFPLDGHRLLEATLGSYNRVVKFLRDWGMAILLGLVGLNILLWIIADTTGNGFIMNFSPLAAYMHFVGGAISQSFLNLFRLIFGLPPLWIF
ncbi:MAG: site-2 protease family protein [Firmicutes bacterium]|nr:site-2 protease family protein [Bacillota bacterium]